MNAPKKIAISLLGESYHVMTDEQERDVLHAARAVDYVMRDAYESRASREDGDKVLLLGSLRIAVQAAIQEREAAYMRDRILHLIALLDTVSPQ